MVTNENDFIGIMMKCKNEKDICNVGKVIELSGMTDIQCLSFIKSLTAKGIIQQIDLESIQVNPIAYSVYESLQKKAGKSFLKLSVSFLKFVITYILGIASGLIIAYLTHKFGW